MKIRLRHTLIPGILAMGCSPMSPSATNQFSPVHQKVSDPASHPSPAAPILKRLPNGHYRVRRPWTVDLNGRRWQVPAGYSTNGITAPASMKKSLGDGVNHPETWAAIFHDWLFTQPGISRSQADALFYDLLIAYEVPASRAKLMYTTVAAYSLTKAIR